MTRSKRTSGTNGRRLADVELVKIDDATNARRYYAIEVRRTLFDHALVVTHGRIGDRLLVVVEPFDSDAALARRYDALVARRRRHGYRHAG